jgi:hypothetical protein
MAKAVRIGATPTVITTAIILFAFASHILTGSGLMRLSGNRIIHTDWATVKVLERRREKKTPGQEGD